MWFYDPSRRLYDRPLRPLRLLSWCLRHHPPRRPRQWSSRVRLAAQQHPRPPHRRRPQPPRPPPPRPPPRAPAPPADLVTLRIDSDVAGAQVFIDRQFIGAAPVTTT